MAADTNGPGAALRLTDFAGNVNYLPPRTILRAGRNPVFSRARHGQSVEPARSIHRRGNPLRRSRCRRRRNGCSFRRPRSRSRRRRRPRLPRRRPPSSAFAAPPVTPPLYTSPPVYGAPLAAPAPYAAPPPAFSAPATAARTNHAVPERSGNTVPVDSGATHVAVWKSRRRSHRRRRSRRPLRWRPVA